MAPNGAESFCFLTNLDLANILGRTDLDFESFHFFGNLLDPKIWQGLGRGLDQAWARPIASANQVSEAVSEAQGQSQGPKGLKGPKN